MMLDIVRSLGTGIDRQIAEEAADAEESDAAAVDAGGGGPS